MKEQGWRDGGKKKWAPVGAQATPRDGGAVLAKGKK